MVGIYPQDFPVSPSPIAQGQLTYWLDAIANAERAAELTDERPELSIPAPIIEALLTLHCIVVNPDGHLHVTDKGQLSLRMSDPAAIHLR